MLQSASTLTIVLDHLKVEVRATDMRDVIGRHILELGSDPRDDVVISV